MALWVRPLDGRRWEWGRDDRTIGYLEAAGEGIAPTDAHDDPDLVTAMCMARIGVASWNPIAEATKVSEPVPGTSSARWRRSTSGRAKGGGPTLQQRATK